VSGGFKATGTYAIMASAAVTRRRCLAVIEGHSYVQKADGVMTQLTTVAG